MERYIQQLVQDIKEASERPKTVPYIETPPHMEDVPDMAELALTGYKSIEEWTGISRESFPSIWHLTGEQAEILNKEIINLLASFNIEIVDIPAGIPREILYDILTDNWDFPVQYLPSSGFDLELCTGVPQTCPYGEFCDCGEEPDFTHDEPPKNNPDENVDMPF